MEYIIAAFIIAAAVVAVGIYLARTSGQSKPDMQNAVMELLQNQVNANVQQTTQQIETLRRTLVESMQALTSQVSKSMNDASKTVGERLDNTHKVVGDVRQQLGVLEKSSQRMIELGQDISKLEQILQPPKLRGALGELFLNDLLAQILPGNHYKIQYRFKDGETVDAVVILHGGMVPIDAKFPLDNFKRVVSAQDEETRLPARKAFIKDLKGHIDAIASKYIRMDENTFDFALMYVPAENVYYETIIKDDASDDGMAIFNYALRKRVIPVSPNSFYAYLQTIILGLKGMRVEEHSREIIESLARVKKEFDRFSESFRLVGQHLENSSKKYADSQKRFGKMEAKVEQIDGLAKGLGAAEAGAVAQIAEPEPAQ